MPKILSVFYDNLVTSDPTDPDVIDISNGLILLVVYLQTLDVLSGHVSCDYLGLCPQQRANYSHM